MSRDDENGKCGGKHLRLAIWIMGVMLALAATVSYTVSTLASSGANEAVARNTAEYQKLEERVRLTEQTAVRVETKLDAIQQSLGRIEKQGERP